MRALVRYAWPHITAVMAPAIVAAVVAVVRDAERHQQRAQIGEAQAQRPVIVRVLRDLFASDSWRYRP